MRGTWEPARRVARQQDRLHHQHPVRVNKAVLVERIAEVVLARKMPLLARREGRLHRRRAHRARAEEGRRRAEGARVPLQAHAAADELRRQPDLPRPDREPRGRPARAPRSPGDPLALPPLPPGGRDEAPAARARRARASASTSSKASRTSSTRSTRSSRSSARPRARPTPRRRSWRASSSTPSRPTPSSSSSSTASRGSRSSSSRRSSRTKKKRAERDQEAARRGGLEGHLGHRARASSTALAAGFGKAGKRRTLIEAVGEELEFSRRGAHRRRGQPRPAHARRLGEAAEGDQGPGRDAPARGRPGARRASPARPRRRVVFFSNYGTAYTCRIIDMPATTGYGEPIQKLFKLKDGERSSRWRRSIRALIGKLAGDEEHYPETYARRRDSRRLRAHVRPRGLRRAEHAERPPLRAPRRGRVDRRRRDRARRARRVIAVSKKRRALLCDVDEVNFLAGAGQGRAADQARRRRRAARASRPRRTTATRSS